MAIDSADIEIENFGISSSDNRLLHVEHEIISGDFNEFIFINLSARELIRARQ